MSLDNEAFERIFARSPVAQAIAHSLKTQRPVDPIVLSPRPRILHSTRKVTVLQHERDSEGFLTPRSRPVRSASLERTPFLPLGLRSPSLGQNSNVSASFSSPRHSTPSKGAGRSAVLQPQSPYIRQPAFPVRTSSPAGRNAPLGGGHVSGPAVHQQPSHRTPARHVHDSLAGSPLQTSPGLVQVDHSEDADHADTVISDSVRSDSVRSDSGLNSDSSQDDEFTPSTPVQKQKQSALLAKFESLKSGEQSPSPKSTPGVSKSRFSSSKNSRSMGVVEIETPSRSSSRLQNLTGKEQSNDVFSSPKTPAINPPSASSNTRSTCKKKENAIVQTPSRAASVERCANEKQSYNDDGDVEIETPRASRSSSQNFTKPNSSSMFSTLAALGRSALAGKTPSRNSTAGQSRESHDSDGEFEMATPVQGKRASVGKTPSRNSTAGQSRESHDSDSEFEMVTPVQAKTTAPLRNKTVESFREMLTAKNRIVSDGDEESVESMNVNERKKTPVSRAVPRNASVSVHQIFSPGGEQSVNVVELEDWNLVPLWSTKSLALTGHRIGTPEEELWRSTAIRERVNQHVVTTGSGTMYILKGNINAKTSTEEGFTKEFVKHFERGFPPNWARLQQRFFVEYAENQKRLVEGATKQKRKSKPRKYKASGKSSASESDSSKGRGKKKSKSNTRDDVNSDVDSGVHMDSRSSSDMLVTPGPVRRIRNGITNGNEKFQDVYSDSESEEESSQSGLGKNAKQKSKGAKKLTGKKAGDVLTGSGTHRIGKRELTGLLDDATPKSRHRESKINSSAMMDLTLLPKTGSGRSVKPALAWWSNERVVFNSSTDQVDVLKGSTDTIAATSLLSLKVSKQKKKPLKKIILPSPGDSSDSEIESFDKKKSPLSYKKKGKRNQPSQKEFAKIAGGKKGGKLKGRKLSDKFESSSGRKNSSKSKGKGKGKGRSNSKSSRGGQQNNDSCSEEEGESTDKSTDSKGMRLKKFNSRDSLYVNSKGKSHARTKSADKGPDALGLTGKVGTMKRKRQLRQMMEQHNQGCEDDVCESTPFRKRTKVQLPDFADSDDDDEVSFNLAPGVTPRGRAMQTPAHVLRGFQPMSTKKTPSSTYDTPGLRNTVNRNAVDLYINRLKKAPKARTILMKSKSVNRKSKHEDDLQSSQLFEVATVSDHDSEEEEDYYWSDA